MMMGFGLLVPIVLILILAYVLGWLPRRLPEGNAGGSQQGEAEDILRQRFARGEIDSDEFQRMREQLRS